LPIYPISFRNKHKPKPKEFTTHIQAGTKNTYKATKIESLCTKTVNRILRGTDEVNQRFKIELPTKEINYNYTQVSSNGVIKFPTNKTCQIDRITPSK
jgi:hypothetical protein